MMIGVAAKLSRGVPIPTLLRSTTRNRIALFPLHSSPLSQPQPSPPPFRLFSNNNNNNNNNNTNGPIANPVALQMINYALSLARTHKSDESYSQASLVLEQCLSTQHDDHSKGVVLLAMSSLLFERANFDEAIEKLQKIEDLTISSIGVRVAATEALVGLNLELGQDDPSSVLADICLQLLDSIKLEIGSGYVSWILDARVKALNGLVELVRGNLESAESFFQGAQDDKGSSGNVALSYGEFLHATQNFFKAKELYEKVIQGMSANKDFSDSYSLAACNMATEEVLLASTCALGQLEAHLGNFGDAEEILTRALTKAEEHFGSHHPKVGVVLTCIALMFRQKAAMDHSSSILIQEGLYRRSIDLLKAQALDSEGAEAKDYRRDIVALARGGYAEILCVQQNRKAEGERMKSWAESAWKNRRLSLAEALDISEHSSKVPVIDARISRVL